MPQYLVSYIINGKNGGTELFPFLNFSDQN